MAKRTRVIIADDHPILRKTLKRVLNATPDLTVVAEAQNAEEVFKQIRKHEADVVVLDLQMPGKDGLQILQEIRQTSHKDLSVVIFTLFPQEGVKDRAIRLGASALISKDCSPNELIDAVRNARNRSAA